MLGFVFGAIVGAVTATYWRGDVSAFRNERVPGLRHKTADKLEAAERTMVRRLDAVSARAASLLRGNR
jgi:hypothetical protein